MTVCLQDCGSREVHALENALDKLRAIENAAIAEERELLLTFVVNNTGPRNFIVFKGRYGLVVYKLIPIVVMAVLVYKKIAIAGRVWERGTFNKQVSAIRARPGHEENNANLRLGLFVLPAHRHQSRWIKAL